MIIAGLAVNDSSETGGIVRRSVLPVTKHITEGRERLLKSVGRVRDLGEVFTPAVTVEAMLDLLPEEMWDAHPSPTFLAVMR